MEAANLMLPRGKPSAQPTGNDNDLVLDQLTADR
jgi:hypothetical protein